METFVRRTRIAAPAEKVFRWHARPGAFERLNPPWEPVEIVARHGGVENGAVVVLRMSLGPLSQYWVAEHRDYQEGRQFCDVQVSVCLPTGCIRIGLNRMGRLRVISKITLSMPYRWGLSDGWAVAHWSGRNWHACLLLPPSRDKRRHRHSCALHRSPNENSGQWCKWHRWYRTCRLFDDWWT